MAKENCSGNWKCCQHASLNNSSYVSCNYVFYCKYQLPNDDRPLQLNKEFAIYGYAITELKDIINFAISRGYSR